MDLLERARTLAACPLFAGLQPAVVIRLAERARPEALEAGERRTTDDTVWIVGTGSLVIVSRAAAAIDASLSTKRKRGGTATPGHLLGLVRVIAPQTRPSRRSPSGRPWWSGSRSMICATCSKRIRSRSRLSPTHSRGCSCRTRDEPPRVRARRRDGAALQRRRGRAAIVRRGRVPSGLRTGSR